MTTYPPLREECSSEAGPYILEWQCPPPARGELYQAAPGGEEWSTDGETGLPLRIISLIHVEGCRQCNYDVHNCPGCGEPLHHGQTACAECRVL